jgi:hypothetical protein
MGRSVSQAISTSYDSHLSMQRIRANPNHETPILHVKTSGESKEKITLVSSQNTDLHSKQRRFVKTDQAGYLFVQHNVSKIVKPTQVVYWLEILRPNDHVSHQRFHNRLTGVLKNFHRKRMATH